MFQNEEFQNKGNGAVSLFSTIVGVAIRAFLAVTTAGFFYIYGGDIWSWVLPYPAANFMAALTGVVLVDGLAFAWTYLRRESANTTEQQNYAKIGAWLDMGLSLTVTAVFIILTTPLLAASVSAEIFGILTNLASWLGIITGVVSFAGNGLIWHFYDNASASSVKQLNLNTLRALAMQAEHSLEMRRLKMLTTKAADRIQAALPDLTDQAASQETDHYLNARFAALDGRAEPSAFDGIEAVSFPTPVRESQYTRDQRAARLSAETRPASAHIQGDEEPNTRSTPANFE